jgi:lambda family phage minor tail protein L
MSSASPVEISAPELGQFVELYALDQTPISAGATVIYLTPNTQAAGGTAITPTITRNSITYYGVPIEGEGFDRGGDGPLPQPTIRVANVSPLLGPWIWGAQDMIGAIVTRTLVLAAWLDGGASADPTAYITSDRYLIEQKTKHGPEGIEFRLRSAVDRSDRQIPNRQVLPTCSYRYRTWSGSTWVYPSTNACPYGISTPGASIFDYKDSVAATNADDQCGKRLQSCKLRFSGSLPTLAFPGVGR